MSVKLTVNLWDLEASASRCKAGTLGEECLVGQTQVFFVCVCLCDDGPLINRLEGRMEKSSLYQTGDLRLQLHCQVNLPGFNALSSATWLNNNIIFS